MDAGIGREANLHWLTANKHNHLVVSRKKNRDIDMAQTSVIQSAGGHQIHLQGRPANIPQKSNSPVGWSKRAVKDQSINESFRKNYAEKLKKISEGLAKPGFTKKRGAVNQRIGRLREKCKRVSAHYQIDLKVDEATGPVTRMTWDYQPQPASKQTHPGV